MKNIMLGAMAATFVTGAVWGQDDWRAQAAAALPQTGEMHLQMLVGGQPDGFMRFGWQRDDEAGIIRYYDRTMWASQEIYETQGGSVTTEGLEPIDVAIRFHQQSAILSVEAAAADGVMVGGRTIVQPFQGQQSAEINVPITDGMVMRGAVFMAAAALPLETGDSITFDWFAPLGGAAGTVTVTAFDGGTIETQAGAFETMRLELRGSSPENDIYVTEIDGAREVVRIDVLGQPMRFEAYPAPVEAAED
jgi:hypothetical protein